jgi:hypothetical protein
MNNETKRIKAVADYQRIIANLLASQASNVAMGGHDMVRPLSTLTVTREELLDRFLTRYPNCEPFRNELAGVYSSLSEFWVDATHWNQFVTV